MDKLNWLITGASSGLGDALARAVVADGDSVAATFRKADQASAFTALSPGLSHGIAMDVTDEASVNAGIAEATEALGGRIDIVVNNAGYALHGLVEQISDEEAEQQFQTNVIGVLRVVRATLPLFRAQRGGRYINISSTAASTGFPGLSLYCASKFALTGFTESLRGECAVFGATATSVEPGGFRTSFGTSSMISAAAPVPGDEYAPFQAAFAQGRQYMATSMPGDPEKASRRIIELGRMPEPPAHFALGDDALPMIERGLEGRLAEYRTHAAMGQGTSFE